MTTNYRPKQDEDIERRKKFPYRSSFRRPMGSSSSGALVMLIMLVYLCAFASSATVMVNAPSVFSFSRLAIPFR
jgi:hypothetical protein